MQIKKEKNGEKTVNTSNRNNLQLVILGKL